MKANLWNVKEPTDVKDVSVGCQRDRSRHKAYSLSVSIPLWQPWTFDVSVNVLMYPWTFDVSVNVLTYPWTFDVSRMRYDDLEAITGLKKASDNEIALTFGSELKWLKSGAMPGLMEVAPPIEHASSILFLWLWCWWVGPNWFDLGVCSRWAVVGLCVTTGSGAASGRILPWVYPRVPCHIILSSPYDFVFIVPMWCPLMPFRVRQDSRYCIDYGSIYKWCKGNMVIPLTLFSVLILYWIDTIIIIAYYTMYILV